MAHSLPKGAGSKTASPSQFAGGSRTASGFRPQSQPNETENWSTASPQNRFREKKKIQVGYVPRLAVTESKRTQTQSVFDPKMRRARRTRSAASLNGMTVEVVISILYSSILEKAQPWLSAGVDRVRLVNEFRTFARTALSSVARRWPEGDHDDPLDIESDLRVICHILRIGHEVFPDRDEDDLAFDVSWGRDYVRQQRNLTDSCDYCSASAMTLSCVAADGAKWLDFAPKAVRKVTGSLVIERCAGKILSI